MHMIRGRRTTNRKIRNLPGLAQTGKERKGARLSPSLRADRAAPAVCGFAVCQGLPCLSLAQAKPDAQYGLQKSGCACAHRPQALFWSASIPQVALGYAGYLWRRPRKRRIFPLRTSPYRHILSARDLQPCACHVFSLLTPCANAWRKKQKNPASTHRVPTAG